MTEIYVTLEQVAQRARNSNLGRRPLAIGYVRSGVQNWARIWLKAKKWKPVKIYQKRERERENTDRLPMKIQDNQIHASK